LSVIGLCGERLRTCRGLLMHFFVKLRHQFRWAIFFQPCVTRIANNLQEPGACITSMKTVEKTTGA
jgi:hypothetical protein